MSQVDSILNNESGSSVRSKLNELVRNHNALDNQGKDRNALLYFNDAGELVVSDFSIDGNGNLTTVRDITTTGRIQSGTNTFGLSTTHDIGSSGENIEFLNNVSGVGYHPGWQTSGSDGNWDLVQRSPVGSLIEDVEIQTDGSQSISNPDFHLIGIGITHRVYSITVNPVNTISNVNVQVLILQDGTYQPYWRSDRLTLTGGAQQKIDLTSFIDLRANADLTIRVTSEDGDVILLGDSLGVPQLLIDYIQWVDKPVALREEVQRTATVSDPCFLLPNGQEVYTVESVDVLEGVQITARYNVINADRLTSNPALIASRGGASENISSFSGLVEGRNISTFTLTAADVNSLRAGAGALRFDLLVESTPITLGCIDVSNKTNVSTITSSVSLRSAESYNDTSNKAGLLKYESLNDSLVSLGSNAVITFSDTNVPLDITFMITAPNVQFQYSGTGSLTGNESPLIGDIVNLRTDGNTFTLFNLGNVLDFGRSSDIIENKVPRFDTLAAGKQGNPLDNTLEQITFLPQWTGNRALSLRINNTAISGFAPAASAVTGGVIFNTRYLITQQEWAQIYASSPTAHVYQIFDTSSGDTVYVNFASS